MFHRYRHSTVHILCLSCGTGSPHTMCTFKLRLKGCFYGCTTEAGFFQTYGNLCPGPADVNH
uniref:Uncharacterized protein n=1 Tax=Anguilla anguilla TaxID=7936 RepID=A0A0E9XQK0_ANGAN